MDAPSRARALVTRSSTLASRWFALWVAAGALAGALVPEAVAWVGPSIPLLLGAVMFGMGMTIRPRQLKDALARPLPLAIGVLAQYTVMPLVAYGLATGLELSPDLAVGVILLGACPGGTASNVVTFLARGDVAFSVAMTSISTLLAPLLTPLLTLWLAGQWVPISASALLLSILQIVLAPVAAGLLAHRFAPRLVQALGPALPLTSVGAIVLIVAFVVGANRERIAATAGMLALVVVVHNLLGLLAGYGIGRIFGMPRPLTRALSFEVGMQNSGLAASLAALHFHPVSAVPGALFSLWHNLTGPALATYWSRRGG